MISEKYADQIGEYARAHRQELVDTVIRLIGVPSVKGEALPGMPFGENCAKALKEGMAVCREYGMDVENHDNYAASATWGQGDREIGVVAHLDVVPAGDGWESDPFTGIERDGFIVGRGSRDNKAGFGAALMAVNCIRDLGIPIGSSLRLIMGSDEESGMSDMEYYVKNCHVPDFSIVTDCLFPVAHGEKGRLCGDIIIGMDTDILRIEGGEAPNIIPSMCTAFIKTGEGGQDLIQAKADKYEGLWTSPAEGGVIVTARGVCAHASEPEKGINAIWKLASFLYDEEVVSGREREAMGFIKEAFGYYYGEYFGISYEDKESGKTTLITGMASSQEGELRVTIDCRYSVTDKKDRFMPVFYGRLRELGYEFQLMGLTDSHYIPGDHPAAQKLTEVFNWAAGEDKAPYVLAGGTYASKIPNSVAFGPGNAKERFPYGRGRGDAHQPDESQDIGYLVDAVKIYAMAIIELDQILHPSYREDDQPAAFAEGRKSKKQGF